MIPSWKRVSLFIGSYSITSRQKIALIAGIFILAIVTLLFLNQTHPQNSHIQTKKENQYWFVLYRKSNKELLYKGVPGNSHQSSLVRTFSIKSGIPGERPTPLPTKLGRKYWIVIDKFASDNPETAPYFLKLDIPAPTDTPFGPSPYDECNGQCNWEVAGDFGLHGVNGDESKLSLQDKGSSGCIRHSDVDIAYLYDLLDPKKEEIRYYIVES